MSKQRNETTNGGSTRASDLLKAETKPVEKQTPKGYTPPKGKPTPKRRTREIERGVIRDPNQMSRAQAAKNRKELKASMSKEEWKEYKRKEREENRARNRHMQERRDAGDDRYMLERDRGQERRFLRDWVDSRRFFNNYFMQVAIVLILTVFIASFAPQAANIMSAIMMLLLLAFFIEGFILGNRASKAAKAQFPNTNEGGFSMGFYAYSRATQPRSWRTPKPQVALGDKV